MCQIVLFAISLLLMCASINAAPPAIGDPAPPLDLDAIVQAPEGQAFTWEALRGKVVVLEFWATWCGPCIPALKHLEEVSAELDDVPHSIIAIAIEEEWRLKTFLGRTPHDLWFATDEERPTFEAYELVGVPNTVIVDPEGRIAALTSPDEVTADVLRRVAAGDAAGVKEKKQKGIDLDRAPALDDEGGEVYASVIIADADPEAHGGGHRFKPGSGKVSGDGVFRSNLIQIAYDVPHSRLIDGFGPWSADLPQYRFSVVAPGGDDDLARTMLARAIEVKFGFSMTREMRKVDCYFLRRAENAPPFAASQPPTEGNPTWTASGGGITFVHQPLENLRMWTENLMQKPVVDETGLADLYDLDLKWVGRDGFLEALREAGFELVEGQGEIEYVVIEPLEGA